MFISALTAIFASGLPHLSVTAPAPQMAAAVRQSVNEISPRLSRFTGSSLTRIKIIVASTPAEFSAKAKDLGAPDWATALAVPKLGLIVLRSPGQLTNPDDFRLVLIHELTHLYLAAALEENRPPLWLEEGLCMHLAQEGGWGRAADMARGVLMEEIIPFRDLEHRFPAQGRAAALAYAQSYYFFGYLLKQYGSETPAKLVRALGQGKDVTAALHQATGKGLAALEQEFKEAMASRFSWLAVLTAAGSIWGLLALVFGVALVVRRRAQVKKRREMADGPGAGAQRQTRHWPPPGPRGDVLAGAGLREPPAGEGKEPG